ncbi:replication initiation factor domain-containing protein [Ligilactobacillus sp. LYQ135]
MKNKNKWNANYIRSLRLNKGLTQKQVARKINLSLRTYERFEEGGTTTKKTFEKIKKFFIDLTNHNTKMEVMIDYLRIRLPTHDLKVIFDEILRIKQKDFVNEDVHRYGYLDRFSLDMIKVYESAQGDLRGTLIELSGQGCRQFEAYLNHQKRSWFDFLSDCLAHYGNVTRIDLAINDYKEAISLKRLLNKMRKGEYRSKFKSTSYQGGIKCSDNDKKHDTGITLYFGSMQSDFYMCFYQKNYQLAHQKHLNPQDIDIKNRYELRFMGKRAQNMVRQVLESETDQKDQLLLNLVFGYIKSYVTFLKPSKKSKRNWDVYLPWEVFLGDVGSIKFVTEPQEMTFEKTRAWLSYQVMPTIKALKMIDDTLGSDEVGSMLRQAKLKERQRKMIKIILDPSS